MVHIYGIPNCSTCRDALAWLTRRKIAHEFHNFKKEGVAAATLRGWLKNKLAAEKLVNRRGLSWRAISLAQRKQLDNPSSPAAIKILRDKPSLIKRPVITKGARITIGFDDAVRDTLKKYL